MKDATFSPSRLLELYDRISDAEDAIPRLRRFVLDLAVRGKLVEQDPSNEPAAELLKRIAQEKARLVNAGQIKRQAAQPPISEDEMPFGLPTGWAWTRLGEIGLVGSSSRVLQNDWQSRGVPFYRAREIVELSKNGTVDNELFISEERFQELSKKGNVPEAGDIMITGVGTIGVPYVVLNEDRFYFKDASVLIFKNIFNLYPSFMFLVMTSPYWVEKVHIGSMGTTVHTLTINRAQPIFLPMPPLAEQRRIVAKVDELMALCDQLERARGGREAVRDRLTAASLARLTAPETDAEAFQSHARFALQSLPTLTTRPDQIKTLRQTILNLAVRGKLVEQDPSDEPAAELLRRIANERISGKALRKSKRRDLQDAEEVADSEPVPHGWVWARLRDLALEMRYGTSVKCDYDIEGVPVLRIPNVSGGRISLDDMKLGPLSPKEVADLSLQAGDLLMIRSNGSLDIVGRAAVVTPEAVGMSFAGYLVRLRTDPSVIDPHYVWLATNSSEVRDQIERPIRSAVGLKNVNLTEFGALAFRLPPLAEQHRIVAKVDALMTLCDQLEASLTTTATTRSKLLNALLHEALNGALGGLSEAAA